eukprot:1658266-Rhodomonas_salina.3
MSSHLPSAADLHRPLPRHPRSLSAGHFCGCWASCRRESARQEENQVLTPCYKTDHRTAHSLRAVRIHTHHAPHPRCEKRR